MPEDLRMRRSLVVLAPSLLPTITVEAENDTREEIHLHAGGQGLWVTRMAALLGAKVALCSALAGECGAVPRGRVAGENVELLTLECRSSNGVHLQVRRAGAREELARGEQPALVRDWAGGHYLEAAEPRVEAFEPRGTGDSMFAALAASLALGLQLEPALRMALAAGCLNATRDGLGTVTRQELEHLRRRVWVKELASGARSVC
jgi:fructose-1-phosphate kinase PfkB-like protein